MTTLETRTRQAIIAALDAQPEKRAAEIALELFNLSDTLIADWARERYVALVTSVAKIHRSPKGADSGLQFFPGFENLSRKLPVGSTEIVLREATVYKLRESAKTMRALARKAAKSDPRVLTLERLIKAMEPHARKHKGLTVADFYELRAAAPERKPAAKASKVTA